MLIVNAPESPRYVTTAPALCLVAALPLVRLAETFARLAPRRRRVVWGLAAAAAVALAAWNLDFYFREYSNRHSYGDRTSAQAAAVGRYLAGRPPGTYVYFLGNPAVRYGGGAIRFLSRGIPGTDVDETLRRRSDVPASPAGSEPLFLLLPERVVEVPAVRARYPGGTLRTFVSDVDGQPLFSAYELPG
jgi:hypothetical protein